MKDNELEQILRQQIEELKKLVELKDKRILELEKLVPNPLQPSFPRITVVPFTQPVFPTSCEMLGMPHEYPLLWGGTGQPRCTRCGQGQSGFGGFTITSAPTGVAGTYALNNGPALATPSGRSRTQ